MANSARDALLDKIAKVPGLGKSVRRGLRNVASDLREEGLEHKALKETTKGLVDDIQEVINQALSELSDEVPEGLAAQITDAVLDGLIGIADEDGPEPEMGTEEEAYDMGAGNADSTAAETAEPEEAKTLMMNQGVTHGMTGKQIKMLDTLIETQSTLAQDLAAIGQAVKALAALAVLPQQVQALSQSVAGMEKQLKLRPRQASTTTETEVKSDDKTLVKAVEDQQARFDAFFNSHVKEK